MNAATAVAVPASLVVAALLALAFSPTFSGSRATLSLAFLVVASLSLAVALNTPSGPRVASDALIASNASPATPPDVESFQQEQSSSSSSSLAPEDISGFPTGVTIYCTCRNPASYPATGGGKVWTSLVAPASEQSQQAKPQFTFCTTPTFSRQLGFVMQGASATGPFSMDLGIRGELAYSIFFVAQGPHVSAGAAASSTASASAAEVHVFDIFANTNGLNGISLVLSPSPGAGSPASSSPSVEFRAQVRVGEASVLDCGRVSVDPSARYMFVIVKDFGTVRFSAHQVDSPAGDHRLLGEAPLSGREQVGFSNKDARLNAARNWDVRLSAFGVYDRALTEREALTLADHYRQLHRQYDPTYQELQAERQKQAAAKECPFNASTCKECGGVKDWTDVADVLGASEGCKAGVATYCAANPSHERCSCWSASNPEYDGSCKAVRCALGGSSTQPECRPPPPPPPPPAPAPGLTQEDVSRAVAAALAAQERKEEERRRLPPLPDSPRSSGARGRPRAKKPESPTKRARSPSPKDKKAPKTFWDWVTGA